VELPQKARLAAIEAFRMERIGEPKTLIVQVVAELVKQRA
jgi:hypothetical protein